MPTYCWEHKPSGQRLDVIRTFDNYQLPPTEEEAGKPVDPTEWERIIVGKPTVKKPWNWGRKGSW